MCDTVAELASGTYEDLGWPELLPFIFACVQAGDPRLQESALLIFAQLARHLMGTLRQHLGTLHEVLSRTLGAPQRDVALAAMRATAAFVQARARPARSRFFSSLCCCNCSPIECPVGCDADVDPLISLGGCRRTTMTVCDNSMCLTQTYCRTLMSFC